MGALCCCCFRVRDVEETTVSTSSSDTNGWNDLVQNLNTKHGPVFPIGVHAAPSSDPARVLSSNVIRGGDKETADSSVGPEACRGDICQLIPNQCRKQIGSKERDAESSVKYSSQTKENVDCFSLQHDDDDCPTCLEEYTLDNPKIITKCNHHYHLNCILEWMERSETCPVCSKKMEFDETT